jgi:hypothetical protein
MRAVGLLADDKQVPDRPSSSYVTARGRSGIAASAYSLKNLYTCMMITACKTGSYATRRTTVNIRIMNPIDCMLN